ncbi:AAA family ATPase [Flavobacterium sp. LS1R49]|uniref:AAA family ATPase n=1 Tax=Flavobacterium shii TaxID=2987687 RepID=A0A9X2ZCY4_9FLAO|nr:AAA family ATPase [Flavobacterium shii]MCV9926252.1 AAA family ATPase [Flavobacterium shii]
MAEYKNPYISRVKIQNFRNFLNVDVTLDHKQVIIGENNIGKTNFLRAIQLILDKDFSDNDRQLSESDFHESLPDPMVNGQIIEIMIQIQGFEHNSRLIGQFVDAVIDDAPPTLQFVYRFFPNVGPLGNILNYKYEIYKGNKELSKFTSEDRGFINIYVVKALRDVERELKANKNSPLYKLVKKYDISKEDLENISESMKAAADDLLQLDEIVHIKDVIQDRFASLSGLQTDNDITLSTFDIDTERLLYTLQVYFGVSERPVGELSLGLGNILYITLMLVLLKDRTIPPIIKAERFQELLLLDETQIINNFYDISAQSKYILKSQIADEDMEILYSWMDENNGVQQTFTILAIEEPEAHLNPILQRLIFREVLNKSNTSVIFTTHSTFISSVAPLSSIVHIRKIGDASDVFSTANLMINDRERKDIERYIDAKRGELYFGKGVILVEGITEEYIIPAAANILNIPLDDFGIVVCNIDSTNFKPYIQLLQALNIPWHLITDGDYYEINSNTKADGSVVEERIYHIMDDLTGRPFGYRGIENVNALLVDLNIVDPADVPQSPEDIKEFFKQSGANVGTYTFEVDMMNETSAHGKSLIKKIYGELILGGDQMQKNFDEALDAVDYWSALKKIESNISKGRFAQRLAGNLTEELIPKYIKDGIENFVKEVKEDYE